MRALSSDVRPDPAQPEYLLKGKGRLFLLSGLLLFLELALIRWLGSNVVYLSYYSNFVLLGSFLGIGLGFLAHQRFAHLFKWAPFPLLGLVAFALVFSPIVDPQVQNFVFAGNRQGLGVPAWIALPLVFLAVALIMALVATEAARTFSEFPSLDAYRIDISGALAGIVLFTCLSFLEAPPLAWGLTFAAAFIFLLLPRPRLAPVAAALALCVALAAESFAPGFSWSPYYKIGQATGSVPGDYPIGVNGVFFQEIQPLALLHESGGQRFAPYVQAVRPPKQVLVIGAGTGDDVDVALAEGAQHVDAVEIDPRIYALGKALHPDKPYSDPRVTVYINDGRSFLENSTRKYDLIVLAATDSIALVLGQGSIRLESYLFTQEAINTDRDHLNQGGVLAAYNYYYQNWYVDRLAATLQAAFHNTPCVNTVAKLGAVATLLASEQSPNIVCSTPWVASGPVPGPVSDDYPFEHLRDVGIPPQYWLMFALVLGAALISVLLLGGSPRSMRPYLDLFFMGSAFLLLETKNVVQFALLFGTTWLVNALVFAGILLCVLAAIEVARRANVKRPKIIYACLFLSLALTWIVPSSALLHLAILPRFVCAALLAFLPVFFANLIFAERFRSVSSSTQAFAANLIGAMVGGILEYSAMFIGYRSLLILIAIIYVLALISGRAHLTRSPALRP